MSTEDYDAYELCRHVLHYRQKNGYSPTRRELFISEEFEALLIKNGVIELAPAYSGGPQVYIRLTDKGQRMAHERSKARR